MNDLAYLIPKNYLSNAMDFAVLLTHGVAMALKLRKTAGVRVTRRVHGRISVGNAARDRGDMLGAIEAYRAALGEDPSLGHIWVQLGHALKETGDVEDAVVAYGQAVRVNGRRGVDALVNLARLEQSRGHTARAARYFAEASRLDPLDTEPLQGLASLLTLARAAGETTLSDLRQLLAGLPSTGRKLVGHSIASAEAGTVVLDCTLLVQFLVDQNWSRDAIRRQCGLLDAALSEFPDRIRLAYFHSDTGIWTELHEEQYQDIRATIEQRAAIAPVDVAGIVNQFLLASALQEPLVFPNGCWIIGLGMPSESSDQPLAFVSAQNHQGVRYAAIVDDLLPLSLPQFSSDERRLAALAWLLSLFLSADLVLAGSSEIASELSRIASAAGAKAIGDRLRVVPISTPAVPHAETPLSRAPSGTQYALIVGDISGAKGHLVALDAWLALDGTLRTDLPDLILLGDAKSADSSAIVRRINSSPILSRKVRFAGELNSDALCALYDGAALILCPTLYEGSNAILADARARGITVIASDLPVLRDEAGDMMFVPPGDANALAAAVERRLSEGCDLTRTTASIESSATAFGAIVAELDGRDEAIARPVVQQAVPGRWHPLMPLTTDRIEAGVGTGANFRSSSGWLPPGAGGCWTRPGGGEITIGLPSGERWRLSLQLRGLPTRGTRWTLDVEGRNSYSGELDAGTRKWVIIDDIQTPSGYARLFLSGLSDDTVGVVDPKGRLLRKTASLGVIGFYVCRQDDWDARERFLETVSLSDLGDLSAYA